MPSGADLGVAPDHLNPANLRSSADPAFFRTALQAGLLGVMANLIPYGLGMVLTGIIAVLLYHRVNAGSLRGGRAARLGAAAGAIAFAATAFLIVLAVVVLNLQQQFHDFLMKVFEQGAAHQLGPDAQSFLQWIHTPPGFDTMLAIGMVAALLLSMLFSAAGGLIGSTLFRDRKQPPV